MPTLAEFLPDTQAIGRGGGVDGATGWQQQLEANKQAFSEDFVSRQLFTSQYPPTMTPEAFVDALNANTGGSLSPSERNALVEGLRGGICPCPAFI